MVQASRFRFVLIRTDRDDLSAVYAEDERDQFRVLLLYNLLLTRGMLLPQSCQTAARV